MFIVAQSAINNNCKNIRASCEKSVAGGIQWEGRDWL